MSFNPNYDKYKYFLNAGQKWTQFHEMLEEVISRQKNLEFRFSKFGLMILNNCPEIDK